MNWLTSAKNNNNSYFILASAIYVLLFLIRYGYSFATGDHEEHLPPIYLMHDNTLYPNDFFIEAYKQSFNIRHYFVLIFGYLCKWFAPENVFFTAWLLLLFVMFLYWQKIAFVITKQLAAAIIAPLLIFFIFYEFTIGLNRLTYNLLIGGVVAKTLATCGIYSLLKKNYAYAGLLFGVGALFQVLSASQPFIIASIVLLVQYKKVTIKNLAIFCASFLLVAAFIIIPVLKSYTGSFNPSEVAQFNQIMYHVRAPWHYLPSYFPKSDYLKFLALFVLGAWLFYNKPLAYKKYIMYAMLVQAIIAVFYTFSIELFSWYAPAKMQWFKSTIWVAAFCSIAISGGLAKYIQQRFLNIWYLLIGLVVTAVCVSIVFAVPNAVFSKFRNRIDFNLECNTDLDKMYVWIKQHTNKSAVFLIPPNDISFSSRAQRSVYVSNHAFVHTHKAALNWFNRYSKLYGVSLPIPKHENFRNIALHNFYTYPVFKNANYCLYNKAEAKADSFGLYKKVYEAGNWVLIDLQMPLGQKQHLP